MEKWKSGKVEKVKVLNFGTWRKVQPAGSSLAKTGAKLVRHGLCSPPCVPPADLTERTRLFALAVIEFCRRLPRTAEAQEAGGQLRRAARAVRSNYRAARRGRSRAEFQAKLGTVFEEADECVDWLEDLRDSGIASDNALLKEAQELASIFAGGYPEFRVWGIA